MNPVLMRCDSLKKAVSTEDMAFCFQYAIRVQHSKNILNQGSIYLIPLVNVHHEMCIYIRIIGSYMILMYIMVSWIRMFGDITLRC